MEQVVEVISGFSKMSRDEKLAYIGGLFSNKEEVIEQFKSFHHEDLLIQEMIEEFSENTISNFHLPYSIAPNFMINDKMYALPMVIEESSVVAAASNAAKFWSKLGGFKTEVVDVQKVGQVHFLWSDDTELLKAKFPELKARLIAETHAITANMEKRGGGISDIVLKDLTDEQPGLMQLFCTFNTADSMGANFINSCLEEFATIFKNWYAEQTVFSGTGLNIIMCILSNLTPNCMVRCWVETHVDNLNHIVDGISGKEFADRFQLGVRIAQIDPYRAVTHNKGIYNGVDAVVLATGNDFRAVEACGHAGAVKDGRYASLTNVTIENDIFKFTLELPISVGVVGGLTNLHPLVKLSMKILGNPSAKELMGIIAAAGLANNFGAVKSLVTTGIQHGHMKMHLFNIMNQLNVCKSDRNKVVEHFDNKKVSVSAVREFIEKRLFIQDISCLII